MNQLYIKFSSKRGEIMKIAILSMQKIINYGSVLQAYSLQQIVEDITGTKVDFIDIEENDLVNVNMPIKDGDDNTIPLLLDRSLLGRIKWKWMSSKRKLFKKKVEYFTKHNLNTSSTNNDKQYDIVIVGSDEVFKSQDSINLQLYGNIRQAKKKITYAASCGSAVIVGIPTETLPIIKRAMSNFSSMSVRDLGTEKYISALYDGKIYRNLDPVLVGTLYKRKHKPVPLKKYMIVYAYGTRIRKIEEIQAIKKFARKHKLKIIALEGVQNWCDDYIVADPFRMLDYFYYAEYVVTDTFHGTIFSIINRKKFATIIRITNKNKLEDLMDTLNISERIVSDMAKLEDILEKDIAYTEVENILEKERKKTYTYLKKALKDDKG